MKQAIAATIFPSDSNEVGVKVSTHDLSGTSELQQIVSERAPGQEKQFIEVLFAANFAFRQLSNLGAGADSDALTQRLSCLKYLENRDITILQDPSGVSVNTLSPKIDGAKKITAELLFKGNGHQLSIASSGFGFMQWKLWTYVPTSVIGLYVALAALRPDDREFIRRLLISTVEVTRQWRLGRINLTNHTEKAVFTALGAWSVSVDGRYREDRPGV